MVKNLKELQLLEIQGIDIRIILKRLLKNKDVVNGIYLAKDRYQWLSSLHTVMNAQGFRNSCGIMNS
jgi:hypothetical protein